MPSAGSSIGNPRVWCYPPGMSAPDASAPRVLIVDDDPVIAELTQRRLQRAGFDASFHQGPFGTASVMLEGHFDLVLLDINMPALDGPQLLKILDKSSASRKTAVLFFSSEDEERLAQLSADSGVDGFVSKSASAAQLVERIQETLDRK
jgi:DNA-binding response OmpR family regulator